MRIGDFNRRVKVQVQQSGDDEVGQPLTQWVDFLPSLPCNMLANTGKEYIAAGATVSSVQVSIRIRWRTDITAAMRIVDGGTIFKIKAVLPDYATRRHVDLVCEEVS